LLIFGGHHSSIWLNLLRLSFEFLTELASLQTSQADVCEVCKAAALFMNLGPPSSRFFFNSGPKKAFSLSLDVKCDQQTHKKNAASNYGINLKKIIQQSSHNIFEMLLAGRQTHNNRAFLWVRGGFYGFDYGKSKLWVRILGVTLVHLRVNIGVF
jgi:hypothetical protein